MSALSRNDNSSLGRWWWTVDRWLLSLILLLILAGLMINLTATPSVARTNGYADLHFFWRQMIFTAPAVVGLLVTSMLSETWIRRIAAMAFPCVLAALIAALIIADETKGASRWIPLGPIKIQPSEFLKPVFIIFNAWLLSACFTNQTLPAKRVSGLLIAVSVTLLVLQPDFGQTLLLTAVWTTQMMLAGLPLLWVGLVALVSMSGLLVAYVSVPYVASRINRFINPDTGDTYQADLAIDSFHRGSLAGRGLGEGQIKTHLPDAHSDYVFAVVGEEFGAIVAVLLLVCFLAIVLRGFTHVIQEANPFRMLAVSGLVMQFGLQVVINIGVTTGLLPSKGMTLPFISYGGSSMLAIAFGMGVVLALTRRNPCLQSGTPTGLAWRVGA